MSIKSVFSKMLSLTLAVGFSACTMQVANAATLYVASWGNDSSSNPYDVNKPMKNISTATKKAVGGDVIKLRGGPYNYTYGHSIEYYKSGRITIQSYDNEWAILDGSSMSTSDAVLYWPGSNVTLQNIEVRNSKSFGIVMKNGSNNIVYKVHSHDHQGTGIYIGGDSNDLSNTSCNNNKVDSCSIWRTNLNNSARTNKNGGWGMGITSLKARNTTVVNCDVNANWGEGIGMVLTNGGYVGYNRSHDNYGCNIYLDNATYVTVEQNKAINLGWPEYIRDGKHADGVRMANEWYDISNPLKGNTIRYNYAENCNDGIWYANYMNYNAGMKNTTINNNTFKNCVRKLTVDYSPGNSGNNIYSNG